MSLPERPLFNSIQEHGPAVYKKSKELCEAYEKLSTAREQLKFNLRCKKSNLLPPSL